MGQNLRVSRNIEMLGDANQEANMKGNICTERMYFDEYWFDDTTSALWTETLDGTSDNIAPTVGGVGGLTLTTGTGDNEVSFLGSALIFDVTQKPVIEARVKIVDVSGTCFYFGFADANTETSPASTIDYADATLAAQATDAVGFVVDADKGTSSIYCASVNDGGTAAAADAGSDWEDNETKNLRIALDASGNAKFYIDGVQVGYTATACADVPLCAVFNFGTRANDGSNVIYVRRFQAWADIA